MDAQTERELRKLIDNPPEGSAVAAAKAYGVDLYSVLENLKLTVAERIQRAEQERLFVEHLRAGGQKAGL